MNKGRSTAVALAVSLGLLATLRCRPSGPVLTGSRFASFTAAAQLDTQFHKDPAIGRDVPLFHVLFVPQWDVPEGGGFGTTGGLGGTADRLTLDYDYHQFVHTSPERSVKSQPIHINNGKTLEAAGRTFDLSAGNVFVADVTLDGTLRITQLSPVPQQQDPSPASVLAYIKHSLPANDRVQQLEASRR
jgi:hypothetical protein